MDRFVNFLTDQEARCKCQNSQVIYLNWQWEERQYWMLWEPKSQRICWLKLTVWAAQRRGGEIDVGQHRSENMPDEAVLSKWTGLCPSTSHKDLLGPEGECVHREKSQVRKGCRWQPQGPHTAKDGGAVTQLSLRKRGPPVIASLRPLGLQIVL